MVLTTLSFTISMSFDCCFMVTFLFCFLKHPLLLFLDVWQTENGRDTETLPTATSILFCFFSPLFFSTWSGVSGIFWTEMLSTCFKGQTIKTTKIINNRCVGKRFGFWLKWYKFKFHHCLDHKFKISNRNRWFYHSKL